MRAPTLDATKTALLGFARCVGPLGLVPLAYVVASEAFAALAVGEGLLTPEHALRWDLAILGATALLLRLVSLFVAPAVSHTVSSGRPTNRREPREQQHFQYRWDELNRIVEARRYDYRPGTNDWTLAARQRSRYDSGNMRTEKASLSPNASAGTAAERMHLYVYPGDFERAGVTVDRTDVCAPVYAGSTALATEIEYHVAGTNIVWKPGTPNGNLNRERRITCPLRDMLGTASAVVDLESGHLLEMATFTPNGAREMDWTTDETSVRPERNAFTGKEEDEEVGVSYFGHRYLIARIGRWASPDPPIWGSESPPMRPTCTRD